MKKTYQALMHAVLLAFLFAAHSAADEPAVSDESEVLFVRRISPLLREKCLGCHGQDAELIEGSIDFRSIEPLTAGGDSASYDAEVTHASAT
jgi:hypothetical protein